MDFDLFKKENEIISQFEAEISDSEDSYASKESFQQLLVEYKKLFKSSKRLIRHSDRNEKELLAANKEIAAQKDQLEQTQSELVQAEKLASLGQLVAGVAHEINTPVGIMLTSASSLKKETDFLQNLLREGKIKKSAIVDYVDVANDISDLILRHCHTTSDLINSFKAVSVDRNIDEARSFDIVAYTHDILRSIKPSMKSAKVDTVIESHDAIAMYSHPGALNQIVTNVILNAYKHGLENGDHEGTITISFKDEAENVQLIIKDTGKGINEDMIDRIFDPFVTSARGDGGTGLGLNIVYNLVTSKLGGKISVKSDDDSIGTTFIIDIPKIHAA